jgi:CheY-like chemotaxis protein
MSQTQTQLPCALVIEDDDHIGQLLQFMLERENYRVHLARDGRAGKAFIESQPPPAIALFDVMLPFFDGFQLVGLVRAQPGWEAVLRAERQLRGRDQARAQRPDIEGLRLPVGGAEAARLGQGHFGQLAPVPLAAVAHGDFVPAGQAMVQPAVFGAQLQAVGYSRRLVLGQQRLGRQGDRDQEVGRPAHGATRASRRTRASSSLGWNGLTM